MPAELNHLVIMRDGVRLATDIYRPDSGADCGSAILLRTPYGKSRARAVSRFSRLIDLFLADGFTVVIQDCRGRWQSEGEFTPLAHDADDGVDTLNWITARPWSNGRIGTYGCSYLGENQILLAARRHPAHRAAIAEAAGGAVGAAGGLHANFGLFENGVLSVGGLFGWIFAYGSRVMPRLPVAALTPAEYLDLERRFYADPALTPDDLAAAWGHLPLVDAMVAGGWAGCDTLFRQFAGLAPNDPAWTELGLITDADRFDTPTLHVNSWYDYGVHATIALFRFMRTNALSDRARQGQHLLVFPGSHCSWHRGEQPEPNITRVGALSLPGGAYRRDDRDYAALCLDWFRHHLRGPVAGIGGLPPVRLHMSGLDRWLDLPDLPLAGETNDILYLTSDAGANSRLGDGRLIADWPAARQDRFLDDPYNPVPSLGGDMCCLTPGANDELSAGPHDQSAIERRHDVLVYTGAALTEDLILIGAPLLDLHVTSTAPDTDLCVKLLRVDAAGRSWNLTETVARCRYRHGFDRPQSLEAGEVVVITVRLHEIAVTIPAGERLRLSVTGSNFPRFARNLHTGGDDHRAATGRAAITTLFTGGDHASRLILPRAPAGIAAGTCSHGSQTPC